MRHHFFMWNTGQMGPEADLRQRGARLHLPDHVDHIVRRIDQQAGPRQGVRVHGGWEWVSSIGSHPSIYLGLIRQCRSKNRLPTVLRIIAHPHPGTSDYGKRRALTSMPLQMWLEHLPQI